MMKKMSKTLLLLLVVLVGVAACGVDEPDGLWAKMKWENVDKLEKVNGVFLIPEGGGTFTFECKNYHPWLSEVIINDEYQDTGWDRKGYKNDWLEVKVVDKKIIFTFDKISESMLTRRVEIVVTAGDIFDRFSFQQH
jgi:hypothetical protein